MRSYNILTFILASKVLSAFGYPADIDDIYYTNAYEYDAAAYIDNHSITTSINSGKKKRIPSSAVNKSRVYYSVHTPDVDPEDAAIDTISTAVVNLIDLKLKRALKSFKKEIIEEQEQRMREIAKQICKEFTSESDCEDGE